MEDLKSKKILVIVESPTKEHKIQKYLRDAGYKVSVMASVGHIMSLADGGSYYNREYVVDFNTLVATGYEDHYVGFEGFEYQHKEFYSKQLTQEDFKKLEKIRTDVALNPQEDVNKTYSYYTIGGYGGSYKIYNRDTIEEIENILH